VTVARAGLGTAMRSRPLGTGYAVWVGIGAVGAVLVGIVVFREPATALRLASVALILLGMMGLELATH